MRDCEVYTKNDRENEHNIHFKRNNIKKRIVQLKNIFYFFKKTY